MLTVRAADERGHAFHGWLDTYHTFSFARYYDPQYMGVSVLRVINDDTVAPGAGFGTHAHQDMEIISYVLSGRLEHEDSMGNGSVIRPGEVQRMSAGTGITHSEFNASDQAILNFLQIWIVPNKKGVRPGYEQRNFVGKMDNRLCLVVSENGRDGSLSINQDVNIYASRLGAGKTLKHPLDYRRTNYLHLARGEAIVNGHKLAHGDGMSIADEVALEIRTPHSAEFLLFDLP